MTEQRLSGFGKGLGSLIVQTDGDNELVADPEESVTPAELAYAAQFRLRSHRERYLAARACRRRLLSGFLRRTPAELVLERADQESSWPS